jgi:hypothetical protein
MMELGAVCGRPRLFQAVVVMSRACCAPQLKGVAMALRATHRDQGRSRHAEIPANFRPPLVRSLHRF